MPTIQVNLPPAPYQVTVEPQLLSHTGEIIAALTKSKKAAIVTDSNVAELHAPMLRESLRRAGVEPIIATIPAGEQHKSLQTLLPVYDQFLAARIERSTPVIALGGGVVGDMAGLVAATLLRGVPFIQIPTTLLAMVDASVGGKVGVDTPHGKNLIGAFHQPIAVLADPVLLSTLPVSEIQGGLAECIKHDIIRDSAGFADLEKNVSRALSGDIFYLTQLVAHNVSVKARVVELDPFERADRAHLNLGHTFGHAIESISNYAIPHGQAVAFGMTAAAKVAVELGILTRADSARIAAVIQKAGLPSTGLRLNTDAVIDAMAFDKKVKNGRIRFILPNGIGAAVIRDDVPLELVRAAVDSLGK
ncbi:MAG TPA: 3-dehydroquinate synthase [Tepidisphaeraceae bacterium]|jgi:3-dehydroquinate synthase|nr:3-dehydroquinate synthase [Tepidisphaeraceae bacterium]